MVVCHVAGASAHIEHDVPDANETALGDKVSDVAGGVHGGAVERNGGSDARNALPLPEKLVCEVKQRQRVGGVGRVGALEHLGGAPGVAGRRRSRPSLLLAPLLDRQRTAAPGGLRPELIGREREVEDGEVDEGVHVGRLAGGGVGQRGSGGKGGEVRTSRSRARSMASRVASTLPMRYWHMPKPTRTAAGTPGCSRITRA